jgi:hypothetical protein
MQPTKTRKMGKSALPVETPGLCWCISTGTFLREDLGRSPRCHHIRKTCTEADPGRAPWCNQLAGCLKQHRRRGDDPGRAPWSKADLGHGPWCNQLAGCLKQYRRREDDPGRAPWQSFLFILTKYTGIIDQHL